MPSPVKQVALDAGIPVFQPVSLKPEEAQQELAALQPDVMIVAAYGLILPKAVLEIPAHGCLNIHASLLPRWRGAADPAGHRRRRCRNRYTIMQMDEGLDTGAMLLKVSTWINADDTGGSLHDRLAGMGGEAIVDALARLAQGELTGEPQNDADANYAHKLSKEEGHIDWSRSATDIERLIRAFNPGPAPLPTWANNASAFTGHLRWSRAAAKPPARY